MQVSQRDLPIHLEIDPEIVAARAARERVGTEQDVYHPWKDTTGAEYGFCRGMGDDFYIRIHEVGSFAVNRGTDRVWGAPDAGACLDQFHDLFRSEIVPFLLQQRSWEVLHGCGLEIDGVWIALSGNSQVGKSTMAHAWRRRGGRVYADDAIPFRVEAGRVPICPIPFQIRLRAPSARHFGAPAEERIWVSSALGQELSAAFMLERRPEAEGGIRVERLDPAQALRGLLRQAYSYTPCDRDRNRALVEAYIELANVLPTFRVSYPTALDRIDAVLDEIRATAAL